MPTAEITPGNAASAEIKTWLGSGSGLTVERKSSGIDPDTGWRYTDFHFSGTGIESANLYFGDGDGLLAANHGESWTSSIAIGLVSGVSPTLRLGVYFYDDAKSYLSNAGGGQVEIDFVPRDVYRVPLHVQRLEWTTLIVSPAAKYARQQVWMNGIQAGQKYDFVLRFANAQLGTTRRLEMGAFPNQSAAASSPLRLSHVPEEEFGTVERQHLAFPVRPLPQWPGHKARILHISDGKTEAYLPYMAGAERIFPQVQRSHFPFAAHAAEIFDHLFSENPPAGLIQIDKCLDSFDAIAGSSSEIDRTTYILDLPPSFEEYRMKAISSKFRLDLGRHERRLKDTVDQYSLDIYEGGNLTAEIFDSAIDLVARRLEEISGAEKDSWVDPHPKSWRESNLQIFQEIGFCGIISSGGVPISVALVGKNEGDYHFSLSGYDSEFGKYSISSVLLLRIIEKICAEGGKRFHLGGGDFGYKTRFGAVEHPLYNIEVKKQ